MTPLEARAEFAAIEKEIGPRAEVSVYLGRGVGKALWAHVTPTGWSSDGDHPRFRAEADDFPELALAIRSAWEEFSSRVAAEQTRKMALAIIRLTYDLGECTDAAIRADGFPDQDLERYGAAAIERANAMSERGPFSIKTLGGSNGMPAEEAA